MAKTPRKKQWGDGSVSELKGKDGKYLAKITIGGVEYRKQTSDRQAAEAWLAELRSQRDAGVKVADARQTLTDWLNVYHSERVAASTLRPRTLEHERNLIEGYILPALGSTILSNLHASQIQRWLYAVRDEIAAHGRGNGLRTAQQAGIILRAACTLAVQRRILTHSPMDGVTIPSPPAKAITPPEPEMLRAVWAKIDETPHPALWGCYILLGLRRGEALGIRLDDVDWEGQTVRIAQQVVVVENRPTLGPIKTAAGIRTLPIPDVIMPMLRSQRSATLATRLKAGEHWDDHGLLFTTTRITAQRTGDRAGRPLAPSNIDRSWRALRDAAGLPAGIVLHHLRHAVATMLDEVGATEATRRAILGHGARSVTQHYTHARLRQMLTALEGVAQLVIDEQFGRRFGRP
jgi:integrase